METPQPEPGPSNGPKRAGLNWPLIIALLIGPAVLALIGALTKNDAIATGSSLGGGLISGMIFGVLMARRFGKSVLSRIVLGLCWAVVFGILVVGISFLGCSIGGFKLD